MRGIIYRSVLVAVLILNSLVVSATNPSMKHDMGAMPMELGPGDADLDLRFIDAMILHHQGAIQMAKEALQKSKRPEIKQLAEAIIKAQEKEIAQMEQWRKAWYPKAPQSPMAWHGEMGHMMPMTKMQKESMMMASNLGRADKNFDGRFIDAMIPHHEGALLMAQEVKQKTKRSEIWQLANDILTTQKAEIDRMKILRKTLN
jgi:uncharacterized protein (DUF305 family)